MKFKDYYKILEVDSKADDAALKTAYRKQARKYHPDVSKEKAAEERFKDINEAYETLKEPDKRRAYDQLRASGVREGEEVDPQRYGGFDFGRGGGGFDPSDLFESLFGSGAGGRAGRQRGEPRASEERVKLQIDLERAFAGGAQRFTLSRQGESRTLEVKIPAGVGEGQVIRLAGQGQSHGIKTDLLLEIEIRPHASYRRDGQDVHSVLRLMPWQAALGATVTVPTLAGDVGLNIPAGSNSGRKMRLKGRGLAKAGETPGDQYVTLEINNPELKSDEDRAAFTALASHFSTS